MKPAFFSLAFILLLTNNFAQNPNSLKCEFRFGDLQGGEIDLETLLTDSIQPVCNDPNARLTILGFGLATKCDGVTRYYKNERNGMLTNDMKANLKTLKPGCSIEFLSIHALPLGRYTSLGSTFTMKFSLK